MRPAADQTTTAVRRRLKVRDAAGELGITVEAVRGRIKRGTLGHHKAPDGTVYVWLRDASGDRTRPDDARPDGRTSDRSGDRSPLLARLEDEVLFLRRELERKDAILLRLAERVPELPAAPPGKVPEEPARGSEGVVDVAAPEQLDQQPERTERRRSSWWRRLFHAERPRQEA